MKSFIFITFAFMGFALYQLSGGDDFEPASVRKSTYSGAYVKDAPLIMIAESAEDTAVTRVSLDLTSVAPKREFSEDSSVKVVRVGETDPNVVPTNVSLDSQSTPAIIPSLIVPEDNGAILQVSGTPATDIRQVTGSRVNVRGGPGTDYDVVSKLIQGDEIEILEDNGNGWVRMRPIEGGPEGWLADFLISSS